MEFVIYEKPVTTKFIKINGEEFILRDVLDGLYEILEMETFGPMKRYELHTDLSLMDKFVEMGFVNYYIGSRMAYIYNIKDPVAVKELIDRIEENL